MLPPIMPASILIVGVILFQSFHTWPPGFGYLTFHLIWKRHYNIERYWPEKLEPSDTIRPFSRKVRARVLLVSMFLLLPALPLVVGLDGVLNFVHVFYAPDLSFFNPYNTYLQNLGAVILLASLAILTWADSYLARYVYGTPPDRRPLLKTGPYRHIRHPVYLSFILFGIGLVLLSLNYFMVLTLLYLSYRAYAYRQEDERDLLKKYGKEYQNYASTTGGFLPKRKPGL